MTAERFHLIIHWNKGMMRWKGPCRSFPMNKQGLLLSVDEMLLHFGNIVRYVVDDVHVEIIWSRTEHLGERLKQKSQQIVYAFSCITTSPGLETASHTENKDHIRHAVDQFKEKLADQLTCLHRKVILLRLTHA